MCVILQHESLCQTGNCWWSGFCLCKPCYLWEMSWKVWKAVKRNWEALWLEQWTDLSGCLASSQAGAVGDDRVAMMTLFSRMQRSICSTNTCEFKEMSPKLVRMPHNWPRITGSGLELYASLEEVGDPLPKLLPPKEPPVISETKDVIVLDKPCGLRTEDALRLLFLFESDIMRWTWRKKPGIWRAGIHLVLIRRCFMFIHVHATLKLWREYTQHNFVEIFPA